MTKYAKYVDKLGRFSFCQSTVDCIRKRCFYHGSK